MNGECINIKKTLDKVFIRIDEKDKALDLKLDEFRPEEYGLASKVHVDEGIHATKLSVHDKVRTMEIVVEEMREAVYGSMEINQEKFEKFEEELKRATDKGSALLDRDQMHNILE